MRLKPECGVTNRIVKFLKSFDAACKNVRYALSGASMTSEWLLLIQISQSIALYVSG